MFEAPRSDSNKKLRTSASESLRDELFELIKKKYNQLDELYATSQLKDVCGDNTSVGMDVERIGHQNVLALHIKEVRTFPFHYLKLFQTLWGCLSATDKLQEVEGLEIVRFWCRRD